MEASPGRFAIGVLSKRTGCNVETIRYYERAGLLPTPARSAGGYRIVEQEGLVEYHGAAFQKDPRRGGEEPARCPMTS